MAPFMQSSYSREVGFHAPWKLAFSQLSENVLVALKYKIERVDELNGVIEATTKDLFRNTQKITIRLWDHPYVIPGYEVGASMRIDVTLGLHGREETCKATAQHIVYVFSEVLSRAFGYRTVDLPLGVAGNIKPPTPAAATPSMPLQPPKISPRSFQATPPLPTAFAPPAPEEIKKTSTKAAKYCFSCGTLLGERADKFKFCPTCGEKLD